jgi:hypothetical protein
VGERGIVVVRLIGRGDFRGARSVAAVNAKQIAAVAGSGTGESRVSAGRREKSKVPVAV